MRCKIDELKDVSKNPTQCDTDNWPTDERLVDCCTPLVRYVEENEMTTFVKQLNDSDNITDELPELPELKTASNTKTAFPDNLAAALFSEERTSSIGEEEKPKSPKRRKRKVCLWKFLYDLLEAPGHQKYLRWEDKDRHVFRVVDTAGLSRLWGLKKEKTNMNYDKMSRAIRQYKHGEVEKIPSTKLTYKFGDVVMKEI